MTLALNTYCDVNISYHQKWNVTGISGYYTHISCASYTNCLLRNGGNFNYCCIKEIT